MFENEEFASSGAAIRHREQGMAPQAARHQCKRGSKTRHSRDRRRLIGVQCGLPPHVRPEIFNRATPDNVSSESMPVQTVRCVPAQHCAKSAFHRQCRTHRAAAQGEQGEQGRQKMNPPVDGAEMEPGTPRDSRAQGEQGRNKRYQKLHAPTDNGTMVIGDFLARRVPPRRLACQQAGGQADPAMRGGGGERGRKVGICA